MQTQKAILDKYMKSIQPDRNHEQDLWINKMEIKAKKTKHTKKLYGLV